MFLVYDITDASSFNNVGSWLAEVKKHAGTNVVTVLLGNKCDLETERKVTAKEGEDYAKSERMSFMETSAKSKLNIAEAFQKITKEIYDKLPENEKK